MDSGRNALRNKLMFLLSLHGLRAKEIASLEVSMLVDAEGKVSAAISLEDKAAKMSSGRLVYMNQVLKQTVSAYLEQRNSSSKYLVVTERSERFSANAVAVFFQRLYKRLGFNGLSSHSG